MRKESWDDQVKDENCKGTMSKTCKEEEEDELAYSKRRKYYVEEKLLLTCYILGRHM